MEKSPAFQFYPADWLNDIKLQSCSMGAQGILINLMCLMHQSEKYGYLLINGVRPDHKTIIKLLRTHHKTFKKALSELRLFGALKEDENGVLYCKRMVKDQALREARRAAGKLGGNPNLVKQMVKVELKQKPTPSSSSSSSSSPSGNKRDTSVSLSRETKIQCSEIVNLYHKILPEMPKVRAMDGLSKKIRARILENAERDSLGWWEQFFFQEIKNSRFLTGKKTEFRASLSWIVGRDNFEKILNGMYKDTGPGTGSIRGDANARAAAAFVYEKAAER